MLDRLWQLITSGFLRVVLPLLLIVVLTVVVLRLVSIAADQIDRRVIVDISGEHVEDYEEAMKVILMKQ